jgi:hypothetical protein
MEFWNSGIFVYTNKPFTLNPLFQHSIIPIVKQSGAQFLKPGKTPSQKVYRAPSGMSNE